MWLDFTALGLSQKELMEKVVEAGVAPNDGSHYGIEGNGFLRINIGTQTVSYTHLVWFRSGTGLMRQPA